MTLAAILFFLTISVIFTRTVILRPEQFGSLLIKFDARFYVAIPFFILSIVEVGISSARIARLRRRLRAGHSLEHRRRYKGRIAARLIELSSIIGALVLFVATILAVSSNSLDRQKPLSAASADMAVLQLTDIDPAQHPDTTNGSFYREYAPFVPVQYVVMQSRQPAHTSYNHSALQTNYYRTVLPCLAGPVFEELKRVYPIYYELPADSRTLDTTLFDEAVYIQSDVAQYIIAYRDKTVVSIRYEGSEYLPDKLDVIADTFLDQKTPEEPRFLRRFNTVSRTSTRCPAPGL